MCLVAVAVERVERLLDTMAGAHCVRDDGNNAIISVLAIYLPPNYLGLENI